MKQILVTLFLVMVLLLGGCATYQYSKNVKLISFEDDVSKGKSVGPIRGEDCVWHILGYSLGGTPTLDKAFASARTQSKSGIASSFSTSSNTMDDKVIRYINNVSTDYDGFDAVVVGKKCLVVKGLGYR
jgi:hypothetical protein